MTPQEHLEAIKAQRQKVDELLSERTLNDPELRQEIDRLNRMSTPGQDFYHYALDSISKNVE